MELVHLHVFERDAAPVRHGHAVAGTGQRVAGDAPGAAVAAGRQHDRLGVEDVQGAVAQAERHDATGLAVVDEEVQHHVLVEEVDLVLHRLLEHRLQDHVSRAVGGVARAAHRPLAEVACVPAEASLVDLAVGGAIEGQPPVLEVVDGVDCLARQDLGGILIYQIVTAFDGVEHVPLPGVLLQVAECRRDSALRRAGVRARWVELADDGDAGVVGELHGGHESGAACADDHHIEFVVVHNIVLPMDDSSGPTGRAGSAR